MIIYWQYMAKQQILKQETPVSQVLNRYKNELTKNIVRQIPIPNFSLISEESKQEASISQIIRTYGKYFQQIRQRYTDGVGGRCVMGSLCLIMGGMANVSLMLKENYMLP